MSSVALPEKEAAVPPSELSAIWTTQLKLLGIVWAAMIALFWRDAASMVQTWWDISTYNHCLLILPIIYWLVHQRQDELARITPHFWGAGLLWIGMAAFGWMLGEAAGVSFARHLGLVMMLQGVVLTLLGPGVARGLLFPLAYSFFLVPFGEELVPFLQTVTAELSMIFLAWANIPAFIDGIFISTPTGYFEVAEACSGIKFLIAMIAYGALVSNVCFKSWNRRILFMLAAIIVPIIANGIRAFGTIYVAHHVSIDFATGFDHIFYGWFFFAFVLALVMAIGWPFFDRKFDDRMIDGDAIRDSQVSTVSRFKPVPMLAIIGALISVPMLWISALASQNSPVPDRITLPEVPGWERVAYEPLHEWKPQFAGSNHFLLGRYRNVATGKVVDMSIAVYDKQKEGREMVGFGQGGFDRNSDWAWTRNLDGPAGSSAYQLTAPGPVVRDIATFYRIRGMLTGSGTAVKLATLKNRLLGGDQHAVAILVSAEQRSDEPAMVSIEEFVADLGPVDKLADEMAGLR